MCPVDAARRYAGCYRGDGARTHTLLPWPPSDSHADVEPLPPFSRVPAPSRVASIAVRPRPSAQQAADAGWDSRWMWAVLGVAIAASWAVRSRR